jgi:hypothetical protein
MNKTLDEEAIMTRHQCKSLILLVEGYSDDKTFRKFLASSDSEIISSWGKDNVLCAMAILDHENMFGVLGIVDADFWHLDNISPPTANVIITDDHDLKMMIIRSKSFDQFIAEVASVPKLERFLINNKEEDIREVLFNRAILIGHLRRFSHTEGLNLRFEGLKFNKFVNKDTLAFDLPKMAEAVLSITRNSELKTETIIEQICTLMNSATNDPYQLCCGHDVISILSIGLRRCLGNKSKEAASTEILESELRMSYDSDCFRKTQIYRSAKEWSRNNAPYQVFD